MMPRIRVVYDDRGERKAEWRDGELVFATEAYLRPVNAAPYVFGDLPDYESPIDGRVISGRAQRREDMKRNGCRPWEGMTVERAEAQRRMQEVERRLDGALTETAHRALYQIPYRHRRVLEGR